MSTLHRAPCLALALCLAACSAAPRESGADAPAFTADLAVAAPPYATVEANWKQTLDRRYVYVAGQGGRAQLGAALERLFDAAESQAAAVDGPPFALFEDDGAFRACLPVSGGGTPREPLRADLLPSAVVVYGYAAGPYPGVDRARPGLVAFLERMGWVAAGPVREVYLIDPTTVGAPDELVTEIQIPARSAR